MLQLYTQIHLEKSYLNRTDTQQAVVRRIHDLQSVQLLITNLGNLERFNVTDTKPHCDNDRNIIPIRSIKLINQLYGCT